MAMLFASYCSHATIPEGILVCIYQNPKKYNSKHVTGHRVNNNVRYYFQVITIADYFLITGK